MPAVQVHLREVLMIWDGVTGSWRYPEVTEQDVTREVTARVEQGRGIIAGGALGVDSQAARAVLRLNPSQLHVILPTSFKVFTAYHFRRASEGVITQKQAEDLAWLLDECAIQGCIEEHPEEPRVTRSAYFGRNQLIVNAITPDAGELLAFWVNGSNGTRDTILKARKKGIRRRVWEYTA
jgi:hypothetical protein